MRSAAQPKDVIKSVGIILSFCLRVSLSLLLLALPSVAFITPIGAAAPNEIPIESLPPDVVIETVVPAAKNLVAMDFTPDGRLLYTERVSTFANGTYLGYVRVVQNGQLQPDPIYPFPVVIEGERGLLGLAVDPNFASNHFVWVYFTKKSSGGDCGSKIKNRVVRFTLNDDNTLNGEPVWAGCFPVSEPAPGIFVTIHNGGNLHFGRDGKLYISVGNSDDKNDGVDPAQNVGSPLGKLHRYNATAPLGIPGDNPFPGNSLYAYGLRNSFDFDFDPLTGQIFATENGDACDDEINRLLPGGNYGWRPNYPCDDGAPGGPNPAYNTIPPLVYWSSSIAPTGITFYRGDLIPEWKNDLFMCAFKDSSTALHHFKLNAARTAIIAHTIIAGTQCRTDVLTGPDGALYYSEGGGYYDGPLKRLTRRSSLSFSSASVAPVAAQAGAELTYTLNVRNLGTLSTTFALTATLPPQVSIVALDNGLQLDADHVYWSGTLTSSQMLRAHFSVQVTAAITDPYMLSLPIEITAPNVQPINLTVLALINGQAVFLPIIRRS